MEDGCIFLIPVAKTYVHFKKHVLKQFSIFFYCLLFKKVFTLKKN